MQRTPFGALRHKQGGLDQGAHLRASVHYVWQWNARKRRLNLFASIDIYIVVRQKLSTPTPAELLPEEREQSNKSSSVLGEEVDPNESMLHPKLQTPPLGKNKTAPVHTTVRSTSRKRSSEA